ncbi:MAG: small-conductance mechanosensitive channel [Nonlabens sp.]
MVLAAIAAVTSETVLQLGPFELTSEALRNLVSATGRIAVVLLASWIVVRLLHRLLDRTVSQLVDPDSGPIDRLRAKRAPREESPSNATAASEAIAFERRSRRTVALASVGKSSVSATVWTLSAFTVLSTVGINLGPYIAGLGIVGVALGFGAQDLVKDFLSGIFMLMEDQYGIGDAVDAGDAIGMVEGVSLRTTRIRSVDGTLWFVPNGEIRRLGNMSQDWARALLDIGVAYDTDTDHASRVILEVATTMASEPEFAPLFLDEPEVWGVQNLGADAVDIRLVIKTTPGDQWGIGRELRARLKREFDAQGIEIPFPQRTMWIKNGDASPLVPNPRDADA